MIILEIGRRQLALPFALLWQIYFGRICNKLKIIDVAMRVVTVYYCSRLFYVKMSRQNMEYLDSGGHTLNFTYT